jgi:hypothetical protein
MCNVISTAHSHRCMLFFQPNYRARSYSHFSPPGGRSAAAAPWVAPHRLDPLRCVSPPPLGSDIREAPGFEHRRRATETRKDVALPRGHICGSGPAAPRRDNVRAFAGGKATSRVPLTPLRRRACIMGLLSASITRRGDSRGIEGAHACSFAKPHVDVVRVPTTSGAVVSGAVADAWTIV